MSSLDEIKKNWEALLWATVEQSINDYVDYSIVLQRSDGTPEQLLFAQQMVNESEEYLGSFRGGYFLTCAKMILEERQKANEMENYSNASLIENKIKARQSGFDFERTNSEVSAPGSLRPASDTEEMRTK